MTAETMPLADGELRFEYDVVIPTHGRSLALLDQAIMSVLDQTCAPRRLIVVVDGHRDAPARIAECWPEVEVIALAQPRGEAVARQAGIAASQAEWICFLDDDDLWRPSKMEITADFLRIRPDCQAVRASYYLFAESDDPAAEFNGQVIDFRGSDLRTLEALAQQTPAENDFTYLDIAGDSLARLLERNRSVIGTTCVRRSLLADLPAVPPGTRPGADHILACLVATKTEWELIDAPLMFYRVHSGQDTQRRDPGAARGLIRSRAIAWELCGDSARRPLSSYGVMYRREFRGLLWAVLRRSGLRESALTYRAALALLPRWKDRALLLVPEPIAWRWHRLGALLLRKGARE